MNEATEMRKQIDKINQCKIVRVKHLSGSSKWKPKEFESWKDFWKSKKNEKEKWPEGKFVCDCCKQEREIFVGAHVIDDKGKKYIYPVCDSCNTTYGEGKKVSPSFYAQKSFLVPFNEKTDAINEDS